MPPALANLARYAENSADAAVLFELAIRLMQAGVPFDVILRVGLRVGRVSLGGAPSSGENMNDPPPQATPVAPTTGAPAAGGEGAPAPRAAAPPNRRRAQGAARATGEPRQVSAPRTTREMHGGRDQQRPPAAPSAKKRRRRSACSRRASAARAQAHRLRTRALRRPPGVADGPQLDRPPGLGLLAGPAAKRVADEDVGAGSDGEEPARDKRPRVLCDPPVAPSPGAVAVCELERES